MLKRTFDREFKLHVIRQMANGEKRLAQLCREYRLSESLVRRWRAQYAQQGESAWLGQQPGGPIGLDPERRIAALEAALGGAHREIESRRLSGRRAPKKGACLPSKDGR